MKDAILSMKLKNGKTEAGERRDRSLQVRKTVTGLVEVWAAKGRKERRERKGGSSAFPDLSRFLEG